MKMKKGLFLLLPVILIAALLGGCCGAAGGGNYLAPTPLPSGATAAPTPTIAPTKIEPQTLIDIKTAETLVGNKLTAMEITKDRPNEDPLAGLSFFLYNPAKGGGRFLQINLYQRTELFNNDPTLIFNAFKVPSSKAPAPLVLATVEGLGDAAYIAEPGIHVMYQGYYIIIAVGDPKDARNQEILKSAGAAAVANLKTQLGIK